MNKLIASTAAMALVGAAGLAVAEPASAAKKYTACVKKSNGELRLLQGKTKKCGKGWKKIKWTKAGPKGSTGSTGPVGSPNSLGNVVDANGAVVGVAVGQFSFPVTVFFVRVDGGDFAYYPNGWLVPIGSYPLYDNATCTGTPFLAANDAWERDALAQDSSFRVVYRTSSSPTLGPTSAYKLDGTSTPVLNLATWQRDFAGNCEAASSETGFRLPLSSVPAPADYVGPLRMG